MVVIAEAKRGGGEDGMCKDKEVDSSWVEKMSYQRGILDNNQAIHTGRLLDNWSICCCGCGW